MERARFVETLGDIAGTRRRVRAELGIGDEFVALFSGKFIDRKRPLDVLRACELLASRDRRVRPLFVGDGPLRSTIQDLARTSSAGPVVTGFVNQSSIPGIYAAADALVVSSSYDPHPLVVTEASMLGLPIVVSDRVGCIGPTDTAREGGNAFVYPTGDVERLAEALGTLEREPETRERMARSAVEIGRTQDVDVAAEQLEHAVNALSRLDKR